MLTDTESRAKLYVRLAEAADAEAVCALSAEVYPGLAPYRPEQIRAHINHFPAGQFVALYDDQIVGYCATFRVAERLAFKPHTWAEITGGGFASRHNARAEWLYGMELFVSPLLRGLRIGQRLYNARKELCQDLELKGIVIGGRIPGFARRLKDQPELTPQAYMEAVSHKRIRDNTLSFQLRNGFTLLGILPNYLPSDAPSGGHAAHLVWYNPLLNRDTRRATNRRPSAASQALARQPYKENVRVAVVQYNQRRVESWEQFESFIEYFVDVVSDYKADFVLFPELLTLQLLSMEPRQLSPRDAILRLTEYTEPFKALMNRLALRYNVNIIGGSHPTRTPAGEVNNFTFVFLRDGSIHEQGKIHPTPNERYWWDIEGTNTAQAIQTDCGPIGVMICYDSEFPELARHLTDQGALILFVPFCTDVRQGFHRVRYSCAARAIENQVYVALAGNVGNLPGVANMDIQYAQSAILTPCDFMFPPDGIAADTTANTEMVAVADLCLTDLIEARNAGSVQNLHDRRFDLYHVKWKG